MCANKKGYTIEGLSRCQTLNHCLRTCPAAATSEQAASTFAHTTPFRSHFNQSCLCYVLGGPAPVSGCFRGGLIDVLPQGPDHWTTPTSPSTLVYPYQITLSFLNRQKVQNEQTSLTALFTPSSQSQGSPFHPIEAWLTITGSRCRTNSAVNSVSCQGPTDLEVSVLCPIPSWQTQVQYWLKSLGLFRSWRPTKQS